MSEATIKGSCLCNKVQYQLTPPLNFLQYCHCSRCRKLTGSAHASNLFAKSEQFSWLSGEQYLGHYKMAEAKHFSSCFCKVCGSNLPWQVEATGNWVVPAGSLDDDPGIKAQQSIFYQHRACWFVSPSELPQHAELPPKKK
jgi:hypothetical protein